MGATVLNVAGDAICAIFVAKKEKELDLPLYLSQ
jgi:Na+/H+-dicarboxylate symporter